MWTRRPLVGAALAYAAGIAAAHIGDDVVAAGILILSAAAGGLLLFYLTVRWQILSLVGYNANKVKMFLLVHAVIFAAGLLAGRSALSVQSFLDTDSGETAVFSGRVLSVESRDDSGLTLEVRAGGPAEGGGADGGKASAGGSAGAGSSCAATRETVQVILSRPEGLGAELTGCMVTVRGIPARPSSARIPGGFDRALYLRSQGILATVKAGSQDVRAAGPPEGIWLALNRLALLRQELRQALLINMSEKDANAFFGILFGESGNMDEDMLNSFRRNGIGHILAASGLHVGFVYGILRVLFRKPRTLAGNIPVAAALLAYAALAGFSASVVRAVLMVLTHIVANVSHRRYDFFSGIAFCFLALLIFRPAYLFSSGFQLSFLAVTTLAAVLKKVESLVARFSHMNKSEDAPRKEQASGGLSLKQRLITGLTSLTAIQAGMLPITVVDFHYISPAVVLLNAPAIMITGLLVPLGICLMPLAAAARLPLLSAPADMLLTFLCRMSALLIHALTGLSSIAGSSPLSFHYAASPPLFLTLLYYFALFLSCSEAIWLVRKKRGRAAAPKPAPGKLITAALAIPALILSLGIWAASDWKYLVSDAVFLDVGQGDCIHLRGSGSFDMMVDSGGSDRRDVGTETLIPYFLSHGVSTLDLVVITHLHTDHYAGLTTMTDGVNVKCLALSEGYRSRVDEVVRETGIPEYRIIFLKRGDVLRTKGGITLTVLSPPLRSEEEYLQLLEADDENALSLVIRADMKGMSFMFTGDVGEDAEAEMVSALRPELLDVDVLKVAHHGSKTSSSQAFLDIASPQVSVIQVGRHNIYGHPTPEALERLSLTGSEIYRTDRDGSVMLRLGVLFSPENKIYCTN